VTDTVLQPSVESRPLWSAALGLAVVTIVANLVEGGVSTSLGLEDGTLALFGFGVDSFIEVISALGVARLVWRIRSDGEAARDRLEVTALRVTGVAFYLLAAGLVVSAVVSVAAGARPESTFWGVVISLVSITAMIGLVAAKTRVGRRLGSAPILADAACTRACIYMSVVLLVSSLVFELTHVPYVDAVGALGIAWFAFSEGREDFEKARGGSCGCDHCAAGS
jgi:divalent metal cation (Fe/Co/Zn/Cd) transporter